MSIKVSRCCISLQVNRRFDGHFQKAYALPVAVFSSRYGGTVTQTVKLKCHSKNEVLKVIFLSSKM